MKSPKALEITKGAFFYPFKTKADLAQALVRRDTDRDATHRETHLAWVEKLSRNPLHQVLIFIGLLQEAVESLTDPTAGCLVAPYVYQISLAGFIAPMTNRVVLNSSMNWNEVSIHTTPNSYPKSATLRIVSRLFCQRRSQPPCPNWRGNSYISLC